MWSYGVVVYELLFGKLPVMLPEHNNANIPMFSGSDQVVPFLTNLLSRTPSARMSAEECLLHPLFSSFISSSSSSKSSKEELTDKLSVFHGYLRLLKASSFKSDFNFRIKNPSDFVNCVFDVIKNLPAKSFLSRFFVRIDGEEGIDAGALTTTLYRRFFQQVFDSKHGLFERGITHYIPAKNLNKEKLLKLQLFGQMLLRAIFDERTVDVPLAPSVWKYLQNIPLDMRDIYVFDPQLASSYQHILLSSNVESMDLYFDDDTTLVRDSNKKEYIKQQIHSQLIGSRKPELEAIKKGFQCVPDLVTQMKLFHHMDLCCLLSGTDLLTWQMVVEYLEFRKYPSNSKIKEWMISVLKRFTETELKQFLLFVTETHSIPISGLQNKNELSPYPRNKIVVIHSTLLTHLPVAHVCFYSIDVPEYRSEKELEEKLKMAISQSPGFTLA
jgi:hypothetical protein